jgi:DNA-binding LacI/PurR family transcriptional regulator
MKASRHHRGVRKGAQVSMDDVARIARVATSTVSRALSGGKPAELISQATARRVLRIAQRLQFVPNLGAQFLRSRSSPFVAVIGGDFSDKFSNTLRNAIDVHLRRKGFVPLHVPYDRDDARSLTALRMVKAAGARRFIVLSSLPPWSLAVLREIRQAMSAGVAVGFEPALPGFSSVRIDEAQAAESAVRHMAVLGHRRIGVIDRVKPLIAFRTRSRAWRATARKLGLAVTSLPADAPDADVRRARWTPFLRRITALVACDDDLAFKALEVAHAAGIAVPAQLSIIGFDDVELASQCLPTLTTLRQPVDDMAEHAIRLLSGERPAHVILQTVLVRRQSTGPAPGRRRRGGQP